MDEKIRSLKKAIDEAKAIVVLGGAGFSTESGIPDFRSPEGLYNKYRHLDPEELLSAEMLRDRPEVFYDFYLNVMLTTDASPNAAHLYCAKLERISGKRVTVITQNIDGLHQKAGSKNVIELHGSASAYYCVGCKEPYGLSAMDPSTFSGDPPLPRCKKCGALVRPNVVMYHEMLDPDRLERAIAAMQEAELVIVGGTSLAVYPANTLLSYCNRAKVFTINKERVDAGRFTRDKDPTLIQRGLGEVFNALEKLELSI